MRSGELFYEMCVLRGRTAAGAAFLPLTQPPHISLWEWGGEEAAGLFQPERFHDSVTLPMPDALPQPGRTPLSLPRHCQTSAQVLGRF